MCILYIFLNAICHLLPTLQGKKNSVFRECYFGSQRHCKLTRLFPACGYTFRVAAHNDIGTRYINIYTGGNCINVSHNIFVFMLKFV